MSYDIYLNEPGTETHIQLDAAHHMRGGTYCLGGTRTCHLNVTYNYADLFRQFLGPEGIRCLYGKTGAETTPVLKRAIGEMSAVHPFKPGEAIKDENGSVRMYPALTSIGILETPVTYDYWYPSEANARAALCALLAFAQLRPDGVWSGD